MVTGGVEPADSIQRWTLDARRSTFGFLMKRILITGASRGIGRAITEKLAEPDVELLLHGRDTVALADVCKAIKSRCGRVTKLIYDLATKSGASRLIEAAGSAPLNVLINNAGIAVVKPYTEITEVEWDQTVGVNVTAPFMLIQHFAPRMPPGSSIVNVLSIAAKVGYAGWSAYCMSKFAMEGFSQCIREELRDHKIRVINVYPGATDTAIWDNVKGDWPREKMMSPAEVAGAVVYALEQPATVSIENITLGNTAGTLRA